MPRWCGSRGLASATSTPQLRSTSAIKRSDRVIERASIEVDPVPDVERSLKRSHPQHRRGANSIRAKPGPGR